LITPNEGIPVIALAGSSFDVNATSRGDLTLVSGDTEVSLKPDWVETIPGRARARCVVPEGTAAGAYALRIHTGDRDDSNLRSVFVVEAFPDRYSFAHLTDTHIGSTRHKRHADAIFTDAVAAVNASDAQFVIVTGDLTENGEVWQFRKFLDVLNTCRLPTFVCSGNHDRKDLNYEHVFGPDAYAFWFGHDAYLGFDTKDFVVADDLGAQPAELQRLRRDIKPARWSIGFAHRYEPDMGMRAQLTLFVDDPLDHLIFGHWHRANTDTERSVPWQGWGRATPITVTPAAVNGSMRYFDVGYGGIVGRPPIRVAETQ
jgi:predicted phosphodiesterase